MGNLAGIVKSQYNLLDVLINNAGSRFNDYQKSVDGIELTFATNHMGHFLLTHLLFDLLKKSTDARIINVSSSSHSGKEINFDEIALPKNYDRREAYGQSKLANVLFTYEPVSYTHLRAHETVLDLVCRLLLAKKNQQNIIYSIVISLYKQ